MTMSNRTILTLALTFWLVACTVVESSPTTSSTARPTPSPSPSQPSTTVPTGESTPLPQQPDAEKQAISTAAPTPTPSFPDLPDLTPPPEGWIAFRSPEEQLSLISPDGSRRVSLIEEGSVDFFAWSPDGRSLAFVRDGQLTLLSIGDSRFIPLTPPGAIHRPTELRWSQDSRHLAYLHSLEKGSRPVAPDALRVLNVSTRQVITVSTYANTRPEEMAFLCSHLFPFPLLGVKEACFSRIVRIWDVRDRKVLTELSPPSFRCDYLWLPRTPGVVFAREETEKAGIEWTCLQDTQDCMKGETKVTHPTSLAVWRMAEDSAGGEAPAVVLEGAQRRHYHPVRWLPDGRLEVRVDQFEKTAYEGRARTERVTYRYLAVTEDRTLQEADGGDLPWWAAGGFEEAFKTTGLYQEQTRERPLMPGWEVGADGETVAFAWSRRVSGKEQELAIYLWRGEGEPRRLAVGFSPS